MTKQSQLERLTQVQLIQRIIHLESELARHRSEKDRKNRKFQEQIIELKQDKVRLRGEVQKLLDEREYFEQERDELIREYNELLYKDADYQRQITDAPKGVDVQDLFNRIELYESEQQQLNQQVESLRKAAEIQKEKETNLLGEKSKLESEVDRLKKQLSKLREDNDTDEQIIALKQENEQLAIEMQKIIEDNKEIYKENEVLLTTKGELQNKLEQSKTKLESYKTKEYSISEELNELLKEFNDSEEKRRNAQMEKERLKKELGKKSSDLNEAINKQEELMQEMNELSQTLVELQDNNASFQERITQLEQEKEEALEANSKLKSELLNVKSQLKELEEEIMEMNSRLENEASEVNRLEEDIEQYKNEKLDLLNRITHLEKENLSFHEKNIKLTEQREYDEKRMDKISNNLNDVFKETKQLVRMTSSLKNQLEAKVLEINQLKADKKLLESELSQFKKDYHHSEQKNQELANKMDHMGHELNSAKQALSRLEQIELEKNQLSKDLELKMEEFILNTENYQREKESYQKELEQVKEQMMGYKETINQLATERSEWSTLIEELKTKLAETKEEVQKMEELAQKNNKLSEELRDKEMEIFKIKKENELALLQKTNHFNSEIKRQQDQLMQSELDRENLEQQINEIKVQYKILQSSLEEKESFIKLFIEQPLPQENLVSEAAEGQSQQTERQSQQIYSKPTEQPMKGSTYQKQVQQPFDWFQRIKAQQQYTYQQTPTQRKNSTPSTTMDFFKLRSKTTRPINHPKQ